MGAVGTINTDIAVIGGSLGGVLAAWSACRLGQRVVLAAEYDWLGGQMTAQGVPPDEHHAIERGGATASYIAFRRAIREHYLAQRGFVDRTSLTEGCNPGDGWVSRLCFEPKVAADYFEALLLPHVKNGALQIVRGVSLRSVESVVNANGIRHISAVTLGGKTDCRVAASVFLDATDTGELIAKAGMAFRIGKESRAEFDEIDAPEVADVNDQQPVTYVMALRRHATAGAVIPQPDDYGFWREHVLPHYKHKLFSNYMPGAVRGESAWLPLFANGSELDWWRYRRVVSAKNWHLPKDEVSLINWAQNDYALRPLLDGVHTRSETVEAAKQLSICLAYWLQTEAPREDGRFGFPDLQLAPDVLGTRDGLAQQVYVRESRRIVAQTTLSQNEIVFRGGHFTPVSRADSVGVVWYNMDIHPTCVSGHGVNAKVRPFVLPVGVFLPCDSDNVLPACKNIGVTHLVNAATRVHPCEWLIGEVAGALAASALGMGLTPTQYVANHLPAFQKQLVGTGIPLQWDQDVIDSVSPSAI